MQNVILVIHLILALCLIGVVLLQRSEGGGLGMGSGGGGGGVMSGRQAATALGKLTWIFAACFIATSIALTILAARDAAGRSVVDSLGTGAPVTVAPGSDVPAVPAPGLTPGTDLLPPSGTDAPATPPRSD